MLFVVSITGVDMIPTCGVIGVEQLRSLVATVVIPSAGFVKLTCHRGCALLPALLSASKAYTLSFMVAT